MTQKEFIESYTKQQACVKKMLQAMRNNDNEELSKFTPVLLIEVFKNHSLTDSKSVEIIDKIVSEYVLSDNKKAEIRSLNIDYESGAI